MREHCARSCDRCSDDRCPHLDAAGALVVEDARGAHLARCVQSGVSLIATGARAHGGDFRPAWRLVIPFFTGMMSPKTRRPFPLPTRPLTSLWDLVVPASAGAPPASLHVWTAFSPGDDTLYLSMLPDVLRFIARHAPGTRVSLECSAKLIPLVARSFPALAALVPFRRGTPHAHDKEAAAALRLLAGNDDDAPPPFDAHVVELAPMVRATLAAFDRAPGGYFVANAARVRHWRHELLFPGGGGGGGGRRRTLAVGVAWRSSLMVGRHGGTTAREGVARDRYYATAPEIARGVLAPLLKATAGVAVRFVRLQYGSPDQEAGIAAELAAMRDGFGVEVEDLGVDLWDDMDETASLIAALDAVVTPNVSTLNLAGALATTPTFAFFPAAEDERLLGTRDPRPRVPWFGRAADVRVFVGALDGADRWDAAFAAMAAEIAALVGDEEEEHHDEL